MTDSELQRLERIVASLAEDNKAYKLQREQDRAEAEAQRVKQEEERIKREKAREKERAEREKAREKERAEREKAREKERAEREKAHEKERKERAEREKVREKAQARLDAQLAELAEQNRAYAIRREKDYAKAEAQRKKDYAKREKERAETEKRMNKLDELFTGQWGKLMEALVKGELTRLLNQRGIPVQGSAREHERKDPSGRDYELDIIAINGSSVVAVEVKTTLQLEHVHNFLEKLPRFKDVFWEYRDKAIIGAVAYLKANQGSDIYAAKQGLYVIRAVGNGASIINAADFKPHIF